MRTKRVSLICTTLPVSRAYYAGGSNETPEYGHNLSYKMSRIVTTATVHDITSLKMEHNVQGKLRPTFSQVSIRVDAKHSTLTREQKGGG